MEERITNNLLHGYSFYYPWWRAPIDRNMTVEEARSADCLSDLPGFKNLTPEQHDKIIRKLRILFAIYAIGDRSHPEYRTARHAVRAFHRTYAEMMNIGVSWRRFSPRSPAV